ncbi:MAG: acyltransferase [Acidimicrobiia bacterium]|nr:acyltransferase [Acidimicrobiia bacterium]
MRLNKSRHVRSLDGLRAFAVVIVILFHLDVPGFGFGYLGVDIFFVLSGFLITSLLIGENDRSGRISLANFWSRRIRRLMPALAVLLVVTSFVTAGTATRSEKETLRSDLLSTTFYVANWHFIEESDYFNDEGTESPLEHTWSLAIEEQFYFFWPVTVVGLMLLGRRRPRAPLVATVGLAAVSALLLAAHWGPEAVERAYMGTDSRVFEPLIGAAAALLLRHAFFRSFVLARGAAIEKVAVGGIGLASLAVATSPQSYYRYGALLVSVATAALVTVLWSRSGGALTRLLEPRPVVWIGALSYGIYLWHWPLIVWLDVREASGAALPLRAIAVGLTIVISAVSYYLVEQPIRRSRANLVLSPRRVVAAVPFLLAGIAVIAVFATHNAAPDENAPVILVAGDSVALHLVPYLEREAEDRGWVVISAARGGCGVSGDHIVHDDGDTLASGDKCPDEIKAKQDAMIDQYDPTLVVRWDRFSLADWIAPDGHQVRAGTAEFWSLRRESLASEVNRLGRDGATVALVGTEPLGVGIETSCAPEECNDWLSRLLEHYDDLTTPWNALLAEYAKAHTGKAAFVSITDSVCRVDESPCDDRIDGEPARPDGRHYEGAGAELAARALLDELEPLLP